MGTNWNNDLYSNMQRQAERKRQQEQERKRQEEAQTYAQAVYGNKWREPMPKKDVANPASVLGNFMTKMRQPAPQWKQRNDGLVQEEGRDRHMLPSYLLKHPTSLRDVNSHTSGNTMPVTTRPHQVRPKAAQQTPQTNVQTLMDRVLAHKVKRN